MKEERQDVRGTQYVGGGSQDSIARCRLSLAPEVRPGALPVLGLVLGGLAVALDGLRGVGVRLLLVELGDQLCSFSNQPLDRVLHLVVVLGEELVGLLDDDVLGLVGREIRVEQRLEQKHRDLLKQCAH